MAAETAYADCERRILTVEVVFFYHGKGHSYIAVVGLLHTSDVMQEMCKCRTVFSS
jgi:hypothetical protein